MQPMLNGSARAARAAIDIAGFMPNYVARLGLGLKGLGLAPVGAEDQITNWVGDIEIGLAHVLGIMVLCVQAAKRGHQWQPGDEACAGLVVGEVEPLVIEEIADDGGHEEPGYVARGIQEEQSANRCGDASQEEDKQDWREEDRREVPAPLVRHVILGEEAVMLEGVALVKQA